MKLAMKLKKIILAFFGAFVLSASQAESLHVASSANFRSTLEILRKNFEGATAHRLLVSYGSSGKLFAQEVNGAPFDIFLSADEAFPQKLIEKELGLKDSLFVYAIGQLVLWSPKGVLASEALQTLQTQKFSHLSIANPDLAPYGAAAKEALQKMQLWTKLQEKIVMGENIEQAYQFVFTGNAELGFVAYSQIKQSSLPGASFLWVLPLEYYTPIKQAAVLLHKARNSQAAKDFLKYLKSEEAQNIIRQNGYSI